MKSHSIVALNQQRQLSTFPINSTCPFSRHLTPNTENVVRLPRVDTSNLNSVKTGQGGMRHNEHEK